jgi:hypothetical protein
MGCCRSKNKPYLANDTFYDGINVYKMNPQLALELLTKNYYFDSLQRDLLTHWIFNNNIKVLKTPHPYRRLPIDLKYQCGAWECLEPAHNVVFEPNIERDYGYIHHDYMSLHQ